MKLSTQILLTFSLILLLSIMDTSSNYLLSLKVQENTEFRNKSQEIIRNSGSLQKSIIEMQSSFRGFLLTRDSGFLVGYKEGLKKVPLNLSDQKELVSGNQQQSKLLDSIQLIHNRWLAYADSLISGSSQGAFQGGDDAVFRRLFETKFRKQHGQKLTDEITTKFLSFDKLEYESRSTHGEKLLASIERTHTFSFIFFGLTVIIGIAGTIFIKSLISKRIKTMVNLAKSISQGNFTKIEDHRKDEMTSLSASLNVMSDKLDKNIRELQNRNAELDKFAYVVSHDLKAPLRGIHNVINWIQEDHSKELSPELQKYLGIIPQRLSRMEDLINGLLDYARIRNKTVSEKIAVNELVQEITDSIVPANFDVQIKDLPVIVTERLKLEQVFTNLVSNAVKCTPGNHPQLTISAKEFASHHEFSVKDNGIGIDQEYHEKVFEIFQTLRERDEKESTGIGLAIVKKILDDQNSTIRINSAPGRGAEFIFTWPKTNVPYYDKKYDTARGR